jgi:hypothetical protein
MLFAGEAARSFTDPHWGAGLDAFCQTTAQEMTGETCCRSKQAAYQANRMPLPSFSTTVVLSLG